MVSHLSRSSGGASTFGNLTTSASVPDVCRARIEPSRSGREFAISDCDFRFAARDVCVQRSGHPLADGGMSIIQSAPATGGTAAPAGEQENPPCTTCVNRSRCESEHERRSPGHTGVLSRMATSSVKSRASRSVRQPLAPSPSRYHRDDAAPLRLCSSRLTPSRAR